MKPNKIILLFVLLLSVTLHGQRDGEKLIHGQAFADSTSTAGINVVNLVTRQSTITDGAGRFSIYAKPDDLLVLSAVQFEVSRYSIEVSDMPKDLLRIKMTSKINELEETVVNQYSHINAEALGVIPAGQKKYTPAERRLAAAQSGPLDIILNAFSGKTAMRKKEIIVEQKERLLERLEYLYPDEFYVKLKIPASQIQGFKFYVVEDVDFVATMTDKHKIRGSFLLGRLAAQYLKLGTDDQ